MITSLENARVKDVVRLRRSRERRRSGLFVAEGRREVERARAAGLRLVETYYAPELIEWPGGGEEVSPAVLRKMAYRLEPEGVLAVVEVQLSPSNCVQCGAIGAKGGRLTPPEGGSGPEYTLT